MLEAAKEMLGLVKQVRDASLKAELQQTIIGVQSDCLALQEKVSDLRSENDSLSSEIAELKACMEKEKQISIFNGCHYIRDAHGKRPVCGNCYETKNRVTIVLQRAGEDMNGGLCPTCETFYNDAYAS